MKRLIRCKDCVNSWSSKSCSQLKCEQWDSMPYCDPNGFCCYGEDVDGNINLKLIDMIEGTQPNKSKYSSNRKKPITSKEIIKK